MRDVKILIVEDETDLAEPLADGLRDEGFQTKIASNGEMARRFIDNENWDLVILDLMLPDIPGEQILNLIQLNPGYPPVLILTARASVEDKIGLFRKGCDDYLTKPFIFEELLEGVRALLRRPRRVVAERCQYEDLNLDSTTYRLSVGDQAVLLTPKEAAICRILMSDAGRIVSRKEILNGVWGLKEEPNSNFIGVHIFNLRKKFAELGRSEWFQTYRSSGFAVAKPGEVHIGH